MIWTINRIKQNFRTTRGIKFSNETIMHFAKEAGYSIKHAGGIIGYDQSVYTALTKAFSDMVEYEKGLRAKKSQKPRKREIDYNPDKFIEPDRADYEWEKNENRIMRQIVRLTESDLHKLIKESVKIILENSTNEINHIAEKSNITVCSLEDFKSIVSKLGINDSNVEDYIGQYCFIEIGSGFPRLYNEYQVSVLGNDENGNEYGPKEFYRVGQWYFSNEHPNVIKLEFDDNQSVDETNPSSKRPDETWWGRFDDDGNVIDWRRYFRDDEYKQEIDNKYGDKINDLIKKNKRTKNQLKNIPATGVRRRHHRWYDPDKSESENELYFYYTRAKDINDEMLMKIKKFVDDNLEINPDVKFVIHCRAGQNRSASIGIYIAKKIGQFNDEFLSEYDEGNKSQFGFRVAKKGKNAKYPQKKVLDGLGALEGWGKKGDTGIDSWYFDTFYNHPGSGFKDNGYIGRKKQ